MGNICAFFAFYNLCPFDRNICGLSLVAVLARGPPSRHVMPKQVSRAQ